MKTRLLITSTVATAALLLASAAYAQGGRGQGGRRGRGMMGPGPGIASLADLSDEQRAAIRELQDQAREDLAPAHEDLAEMRGELQALWAVDRPNARAILAKHAQMQAVRDVVRDRMAELRSDIESVLTPGQRAALAEHRASRPGRGQGGEGAGGIGRRGGRGHGGGDVGHAGRGPGLRTFGSFAARQLELTEEQQAQIAALRSEAHDSTVGVRAELREVRQALRAARRSGQGNPSAIAALEAREDAAQQTMLETQVHTRIAIMGLLTAEQRAELQALAGQRHGRRGQGGGPRGPGGGRGGGPTR